MMKKNLEMTVEEASKIFYINQEIKNIQIEMASLQQKRRYFKPVLLSDMPKGSSSKNDELEEMLDEEKKLDDMYNYSLRSLQYELRKFNTFLDTVEDPEIRSIIRMRCVNNMKWDQIGAEIGMDRRTASRKFYGFFKNAHNAHE